MTVVLVLHANGQVNTLKVREGDLENLNLFRSTIGVQHLSVLHLMRPDSNDVAVAWYGAVVNAPANEPATKLARHCGALHPLESINGPIIVAGVPEGGSVPITDPPAWASEVVYRYGREERERRKPRPRNQG